MEHVILGLLMLSPMTVYELNKAFEKGVSLFYSASLGSIQIALKKLLEKEYVVFNQVSEQGRVKKIYTITPSGRAAFYRWMFEADNQNKLETQLQAKVYFLDLVDNAQDQKEIIANMITACKARLESLKTLEALENKTPISDEMKGLTAHRKTTFEFGVSSCLFMLDWLTKLHDSL